jgi:hypothetical protein
MVGLSVKPPKAKPKVQRKKEHPNLFTAQNNPSNLTAKIFVIFLYFYSNNQQPLEHSLGFHACVTQPFCGSLSPWSKSVAL